jgi:hypothetical protein
MDGRGSSWLKVSRSTGPIDVQTYGAEVLNRTSGSLSNAKAPAMLIAPYGLRNVACASVALAVLICAGSSLAAPASAALAVPAVTQSDDHVTLIAHTKKHKKRSKACKGRKIRVEGRCMLPEDAAGFCGPGYRHEKGKCVFGYKAPDKNDKPPSWQAEAIKHGCKPGMAWNKAEGCHEND